MGGACSCCGPTARVNSKSVKPKDSSSSGKGRPPTPRAASGSAAGAGGRGESAVRHNRQAAKEHVSFLEPDGACSSEEEDDESRQQELEAELETCARELQRAASFCSSAGGFSRNISRNISKAGGQSSSLECQQQHSTQSLQQDAVMELAPWRAGGAASAAGRSDEEQRSAPGTPMRRQKTPSPSRSGGRNVVRPSTLLPGGEDNELLQL